DAGFSLQELKASGYTLTTQKINYLEDGKTILYIETFDYQTDKKIKEEAYRPDGKTIAHIDEFNPEGKPIKTTYFQADGKTISSIDEYNPEGIKIIKKTYYNPDGTVKEVKTFQRRA
ncbi:MAG: DUF2963 domain-containing protein, partial [Candidatus Phytoplasma sp. TWB_XP]